MMKIIAFITQRRVIRAILASVRRSGTPSAAGSRPPRRPPLTQPRMVCSKRPGEGTGAQCNTRVEPAACRERARSVVQRAA